jgi:hypothetical protein
MYEEAKVITKYAYEKGVQRGTLNLIRRACRNTPALIEFETMRQDIKDAVVKIAGHPSKKITKNILEDLITIDQEATEFYGAFRKDNGEPLPFDTQKKYVRNASILNGIQIMITDKQSKARALGLTKSRMWQNVSKAVKNMHKFEHSVPGNYSRV